MTPPPAPDGVPEMTVTELKRRLASGPPLTLVDVRETFEHAIADLPAHGQRRMPLQDVPARMHELDHGEAIVVYCRSGQRSASVARLLLGSGYPSVWNLRGGVMAWRAEIDPTLQAY